MTSRPNQGVVVTNPIATILSVSHLTVELDGRTIIADLSFEIHDGETLAIIGPNGSGKTVLLRTLLGMLPHQGAVHWAENIHLGYVPQRIGADRLLPLSTLDLLGAKARLLKLNSQAVDRVVSITGLTPDLLKANLGILSGGQFQKVLIAAALLGEPNVILFDEPTASLDELSEERVYELLHRLRNEHGLTMVLVSHDLSIVYQSATSVLCLGGGGTCFGRPKEVLTPEALERMYAVPPKYYQHLLDHHKVGFPQ